MQISQHTQAMKYDKPNLEQRVRKVLDANFPEWVWNLKKGDKFAITGYGGSHTLQGERLVLPKIFICISGNEVWYQDMENPRSIAYTTWETGIVSFEKYEKIEQELCEYRLKNPDWQNVRM